MEFSKKSKRILNTLSPIFFIWLVMAINSSSRNHEFAEIADSLSGITHLGSCIITTDLERDWPSSWSPSSMTVQVSSKDESLSIPISKYSSPPDRLQLSPGYTRYHFTWSKRVNDALEVSFMDVEINRIDEVKKLAVGVCSKYPENAYNWNNMEPEKCIVNVRLIKCS